MSMSSWRYTHTHAPTYTRAGGHDESHHTHTCAPTVVQAISFLDEATTKRDVWALDRRVKFLEDRVRTVNSEVETKLAHIARILRAKEKGALKPANHKKPTARGSNTRGLCCCGGSRLNVM